MTYPAVHLKTIQYLFITVFLSVFTLPAQAAIPDNIDYQGYLTDDAGTPITGPVSVTFALYNGDTGGVALWSDTQSITPDNGLFSVKLGRLGNPFPVGFFDDPLWLGITVETDSEMAPRIALSSVGFAHKADDALTLQGQSAASLDQSSHVTDTSNPHAVSLAHTGGTPLADFSSHTLSADTHHSKTTFFTELFDQASDAQLPATITRDSELVSHAGVPDAHHTKTTSFADLTDLAADAQIPDTITINHAVNADTLDSLDSTAFMSSGADNWVNTAGDTMTGNLNVQANVGIGIATPTRPLHVVGSGSGYLGWFWDDNNDASGNAFGISVTADAYDTGIGISVAGYFKGKASSISGSAYGTQNYAEAFGTSNAIGVYSNAIGGTTTGREYAFYGFGDAYVSGDVGIGTIAPSAKLQVIGNGVIGSSSSTATGVSAVALGANADATNNYAFATGTGTTASGPYSTAMGVDITVSGIRSFGIGLSGPATTVSADNVMAIMGGNVGIGTTTPLYNLHVIGSTNDYIGYFDNDNNVSGNTYGIYVEGDAHDTVTGWAQAGTFYAYGGSANGNALATIHYAAANGSSDATGVYVNATAGSTTGNEWAFWGYGDGVFSGNITKGGGSFKIDHPLAPQSKYLYHSFVESPDMMNVYNGNIILDENGEATVTMPDWFEALNKDFRYQLTPIGAAAVLYIAQEIKVNTFSIAGGKPGMKVSWQVTGIRQDAYANAKRIPVEEDKPTKEVGTYLHPEAFGVSNDRSLANAQALEMGLEVNEPR